jgi:hypothetical protein
MVRIGQTGSDVYPLDPKPALAPQRGRTALAEPISKAKPQCDMQAGVEAVFASEFIARSSGPIFFYVNDAIPLPFTSVYGNNRGTACLYIEPIPQPSVPADAKPISE